MKKMALRTLTVAVGGLALSMTAGAGLASAEPDLGPMVNSPCSYEQAMAAVHAENPMAARYLDQSPPNQQFLRVFLSSSQDQRVNLLNQIKNNQGAAQALPVFTQMLTTCVNY